MTKPLKKKFCIKTKISYTYYFVFNTKYRNNININILKINKLNKQPLSQKIKDAFLNSQSKYIKFHSLIYFFILDNPFDQLPSILWLWVTSKLFNS
jgi:hypothetical protein